jgi:hypothetical protein
VEGGGGINTAIVGCTLSLSLTAAAPDLVERTTISKFVLAKSGREGDSCASLDDGDEYR